MTNRFTAYYPELGHALTHSKIKDILLDENVETSDVILRQSPTELREFCEHNTKIYKTLADRAFKMVSHVPKDFDGTVVVVPTGLGSGIGPGAVTQARIIREIVDPQAALLVPAHASFGTPVNNFSAREAWKLQSGDVSPLTERLKVGLDQIEGVTQSVSKQAVYLGASLGAVTTSAALTMNREMPIPAVAGTLIEPVHVRDWSDAGLGLSYVRSLGDFPKVFDLDAPEGMTGQEMLDKFKTNEPKFSIKAAAENIALSGILRWNRLGHDLRRAPEGVGIVHAWSLMSHVSPHEANMEVAYEKCGDPHYQYVIFQNEDSEHGLTVAYPLHGVLARRAFQLHELSAT